ncbi:copper resistance CopC/CopD family protein [Effusibacillus dendaii]|uniref:CopC domain-containing protein n=1 Tax=Effusibacillus dendaii TaxID=2743772 RepID=A0A7I8DD96_9BACL|nr:copper resistance protein CopC [Effusibacillus dendaii]BCJ88193.1 hypothetical protein skT53_31780 [Effusibacillus dendaii]
MKRFSLWLISLGLLLCLFPSSAFAHANLITSSPESGEIVQQSPQKIIMDFSEPLELETVGLYLQDRTGKKIPVTELKLTPGNARELYAKLPPLAEGTYVLVAGILAVGFIVSGITYSTDLPNSFLGSVFGEGKWYLLKQAPLVAMLAVQLILLLLLAIPGMVESWYPILWGLLVCANELGGHAWGIEPLWLALASRALHLAALSLWLGALTYLGLTMIWKTIDGQNLDRQTFRPFFVQTAALSAIFTIGSGLFMMFLQTDWTTLTAALSSWTFLLVLKIVLVLAMLLLALRQTLQWRKDAPSLSQTLLG